MEKTSSGSEVIDGLLDQGFENSLITTVYGPASSGKTNLCLLTTIQLVKNNKKVVFIDTESNLSVERLKQLTPDFQKVLDNMIIITPDSLEEQEKALRRVKSFINEDIGIIILDSVATPYRLELSESSQKTDVNRVLGKQLDYLLHIAREHKIPVLVTNQVYSAMDDSDNVRMVGGDLLVFASKCLIELKKLKSGIRKAILRRHRSLPEDREVSFRIVEKGFEAVE